MKINLGKTSELRFDQRTPGKRAFLDKFCIDSESDGDIETPENGANADAKSQNGENNSKEIRKNKIKCVRNKYKANLLAKFCE